MWWSWFLYADKHESLLQIDTMILMGMVKYSQSSQNSKVAMSLQYLKKELRDEVDFLHGDKHQSFNKLESSFLMEVAKFVESTQNRNSVIFLEYAKKKEWQILLYTIVMQNIQIFYGVQSCLLLLVGSNIIYKTIYKIIAYPIHSFDSLFKLSLYIVILLKKKRFKKKNL